MLASRLVKEVRETEGKVQTRSYRVLSEVVRKGAEKLVCESNREANRCCKTTVTTVTEYMRK